MNSEKKRAIELRRVRAFVELAMKKDPRRRLAKQKAGTHDATTQNMI
jgi:hypothetical protein